MRADALMAELGTLATRSETYLDGIYDEWWYQPPEVKMHVSPDLACRFVST